MHDALRLTKNIFAVLLASLSYPIKSLIINLFLLIVSLLLGLSLLCLVVVSLFALPLVAALLGFYGGSKLSLALANRCMLALWFSVISLITMSIIALITPVVVIGVIGFQLIAGIVDFVRTLIQGAQEGWYGGPLLVIKKLFIEFTFFSSFLQIINSLFYRILPSENSDLDLVAHDSLMSYSPPQSEEKVDFGPAENYHSLKTVLSRCKKDRECSKLLKKQELQAAQQIKTIHLQVERYQDLQVRLTELHKNFSFDDEAADLGTVEKPALFFKEFEDKVENKLKWRVIPGTTKITDYDLLNRWFDIASRDPQTNESIKQPRDYDNKATRYRMTPYTGKDSCRELTQLAKDIRSELKKHNISVQKEGDPQKNEEKNSIFMSIY